jgi:hypothetical protein
MPLQRGLPETRQGVEHGALSGVGVARQRDDMIHSIQVHAELPEIGGAVNAASGAGLFGGRGLLAG